MRAVERGTEIGQHGVARLLTDLPRHRQSSCESVSTRHKLPNEADLKSSFRRDPLARDDQGERRSPADESRQLDGPPVDERHSPAAASDRKGRLRLGQPNVPMAEEFETARVCVTLRDGDHRL